MTPPCCLLELEHTCGKSHLRPVITFKFPWKIGLENGKPRKNIGKMIGKLFFPSLDVDLMLLSIGVLFKVQVGFLREFNLSFSFETCQKSDS